MNLSLAQILILAVVQGVTEFLPVSSSGHLVILAAVMSPTGDTAGLEITDVSIMLHAGTLASILVFYRRRVWRLLGKDRPTVPLLVVGTLPAVAIGLPLKKYGQAVLENPLLAGLLLLVTGAVLLRSSRKKPENRTYQELSFGGALRIGLAQAAAILPGLSRSGLTICSGLDQGLSRRDAATFSFLLAIPAIAGACTLDIVDLAGAPKTPPGYLAMGALVSFVVGLASLWWLVRWLERGRLHHFAYWCIFVGAGVTVWQSIR